MSDLFSYLDCNGPEYGYLGHFRAADYLYEGHNDLGLEQQIEAGNIPDLHSAGKNIPAEAEPGNIASQGGMGTSEGTPSRPPSSPTGSSRGVGSALGAAALGTVADLASGSAAQDFTPEEGTTTNLGATFGSNLAAGGGVGSALAGIFGI